MSNFKCPKLLEAKKHNKYSLVSIFNVAAGNRSKLREMFEKTHTKVYVYDNNMNKVSEDEIASIFNYNHPGNQCIVIEGETGTGKSELCVKLVYDLEDRGWEVVHIPKNMDLTTMKIHLLEFYKEKTGTSFPKSDNALKLQKELKKTNKRHAIAKQIVGRFFEEYVFLEDINENKQGIIDAFEKAFGTKIGNIIRTDSSLYITDYEANFFTSSDINQFNSLKSVIQILKDNHTTKNWMNDEEYLKEINSNLWSNLNEHFGAPSFEEIMNAISEHMNSIDKRVAMIMEDLKIATLDLNRLLKYMERDVPDDRWDFLIAGTTDIISIVKEEATRRDRFHFFRTNEQENTNVLFLNSDTSFNFAKKYFEFIQDMFGNICKNCQKCPSDKFKVLFPANEAFIKRLFDKMDEKKPRTFIQNIYRSILHYLEFEEPPTESSEVRNLKMDYLEFQKPIYDEKLRRFISFYYTKNNINGNTFFSLEKDYFNFFNLDLESIEEFKRRDHQVLIPEKGKTRYKSDTITQRTEKTDFSTIEEELTNIEKLEKKYVNVLELISPWSESTQNELKTKYQDINSYFKIGMKEIMGIFTNGYSLKNLPSLTYRYGKNEYPIIHENDKKSDKDLLQITIDQKSLPMSLLRKIILIGCAIDDKSSISFEEKLQLCEEGIPLFLSYAQFWRQDFIDYYYKQFSSILKRSNKKETNIINKALSLFLNLLLKISYPHKEIEDMDIYSILVEDEQKEDFINNLTKNCKIVGVKKSLRNNIKDDVQSLLNLYLEQISSDANILSEEDFSYIREQAQNKINIGYDITKNNINNLDNKVRFADRPLSEFLLTIKDLHLELERMKKVNKFNFKDMNIIIQNLEPGEINQYLEIYNKNKNLVENLDYDIRRRIVKIGQFLKNDNISEIRNKLKNLKTNLKYLGFNDFEEDVSISIDNLEMEYYIFWKWFTNLEEKKEIINLINRNFEDLSDNLQNQAKNILQMIGEIHDVIS